MAAINTSTSEDAAPYTLNLLSTSSDPDSSNALSIENYSASAVDGNGTDITIPDSALSISGAQLTVDPNSFNHLAVGESVVITVQCDVSDGITATPNTATITVTGANDSPVITTGLVTGSITETDAAISTTGDFSVADPDTSDTVTASVQSVDIAGSFNGTVPSALTDSSNQQLLDMLSLNPVAGAVLDADQPTGSDLTWTFSSAAGGNSAFDFLAKDETLELTYNVQFSDNSGSLNHRITSIVVTVTGTNDTPEITIDAGNDTGSTTEDLNTVSIDAAEFLQDTGTISFNDVDLANTGLLSTILHQRYR